MKRALPLALAVLVIGVVVILVSKLITSTPREPSAPMSGERSDGGLAVPVELPRPRVPTLKPALSVVDADGGLVDSAQLIIGARQPFDLRISIEADAFVYVFDKTEGELSVVWRHEDPAPWEKGEYSADSPVFEGLGEHELVVVASPKPLDVTGWKALSNEIVAQTCPQCETNSYLLFVKAAPDAGVAAKKRKR